MKETIIEIIRDLQNALRRAEEYGGYKNNREREALINAIKRSIQHANNQLLT